MLTFTPILLDAGGPLLLLFVGVPIVLAVLAVIVLAEAVLLRVMNWHPSFGRCLLHSLAINAASSVAGCALLFWVQFLAARATTNPSALWTIVPFVVAFVISVLIEGMILRALKPAGASAWRTSLVINAASYVFLAGVVLTGANL